MSTAVLLSGQFRTFKACLPTQHWHVYRHLPDLHFFLVMQNTLKKAGPNSPDPVNSEAMVKLLEDKYGKERVHAKLIDDPQDLPMIEKVHGAHAPYQNAAPHPQLMMQHWYQNEVWKWFRETKGDSRINEIIRMRGDNFFKSFDRTQGTMLNIVRSPWWGRFGGINDRFAIMGMDAAAVYFTLYEKLDELLAKGCPFHPESLLLAHLQENGIVSHDTLNAIFDTHRLKGDHRAAESEMLPADIARGFGR